jgi:predicted RND superfamily exporter protein
MTMATTFVGFIPIMWATGTGSDVWKRIAAPMVGGIFTSFLLELVVYPAIYEVWKWHFELERGRAQPPAPSAGRHLLGDAGRAGDEGGGPRTEIEGARTGVIVSGYGPGEEELACARAG